MIVTLLTDIRFKMWSRKGHQRLIFFGSMQTFLIIISYLPIHLCTFNYNQQKINIMQGEQSTHFYAQLFTFGGKIMVIWRFYIAYQLKDNVFTMNGNCRNKLFHQLKQFVSHAKQLVLACDTELNSVHRCPFLALARGGKRCFWTIKSR